ncbi:uncharacterized protein PRCAT00002474001 [Priceomyces carsonii]|uniref:uncharacterized protein n=1 Tax=Priceomyces carsonii TaxID=28549 RepID=UPI002ED7CB8D|nr:unnamed protein product [Priceomyces carsonii]
MTSPSKEKDTTYVKAVGCEESSSFIGQNDNSNEIEKKVLRKFDLLIIPCLCLAYLFSNLDKSNIGNAEAAGMSKDLKLVGNQYGNVVSLLYVTYVIFETPIALSLKYIGPKYVLSVMCLLFGISCLCTSFANGYHSLLACRLLVGLFESGIIPCINVYLGMLYTRGEMAKRCSAVYAAGATAGAFGGLLAFGITKIETENWQGWRFLFAIEGALTIMCFPVLITFLPRDVTKVWWLSEEEKRFLENRMRSNPDFHMYEKFSWSEVIRGLKDKNTILVCLYQFCVDITLFGISTFLPSIIKGMGYGSYSTQLLTIPFYVVALISFVTVAYFSDKTGNRGFFIIGGVLCEVIGYAILIGSRALGARYFGCMMLGLGIYVCSGLSIMWVNNNNAGHYKRATAAGMCTTVGNVAGVVTGQIYTADTAPRYFKGLKTALGMTCGALIFVSSMVFNFDKENKKREKILNDLEGKDILNPEYFELKDDTSLTFKFLL